jgi:outer membrane murein-binding lipoprotein Lpp
MSEDATQAALREMSHQIGGLEAIVKTLVSTWQSQEATATQGRANLHAKVEALGEKVSTLASRVDVAIKDITEIKPSVEAFENAKAQAIGAQKLGKWIWAALPFAGGGIGWAIANWISIGPKPH